MRLDGPNGDYLDLAVVGYQFSEDYDVDDRNWLVIQGQARQGPKEWAFRNACLTTKEIVGLVVWFERLAEPAHHHRPDRLSFIEPNLAFEVRDYDGEAVSLSVELNHEMRGDLVQANDRSYAPFIMHFHLGRDAIRQAVAALTAEADHFPVR
jgi:hypothetical protein